MDLMSSQEIKFNIKDSKLEEGYSLIKAILNECPSGLIVEILNDKDGNADATLNYLMDNPSLIQEYINRKNGGSPEEGANKFLDPEPQNGQVGSNDPIEDPENFDPSAPLIDPIPSFNPEIHNNGNNQQIGINNNLQVNNGRNNFNVFSHNVHNMNNNHYNGNINVNNIPLINNGNMNQPVNDPLQQKQPFNPEYQQNPSNNPQSNNNNPPLIDDGKSDIVQSFQNMLKISGNINQFLTNEEQDEETQSRLFIEQLLREENRIKEEEEKNNMLLLNNLLEEEKKQKQKDLDNKLYHCTICDDEEVPISNMYIMEDCFHKFCVDCLKDNFRYSIENGKIKEIVCPRKGCSRHVSYQEIKQVVQDQKLFDKYESFLLESVLVSDPNCRFCPKPGCGVAVIGGGGLKIICPSPKCGFAFCFNCKESFHDGFSCDQYQQWKIENGSAETRFQSWVVQNSKKCPSCHSNIEKNDGCNHMTCRCGYQFCWLCMEKYSSDHWTKSKKGCKQFTNN